MRIKHVNLPRIRRYVLVAEHRTLWRACCPASILKLRNVLFRRARLDSIIAIICDQRRIMRNSAVVSYCGNVPAFQQPVGPAFRLGQRLGDAADNQFLQAAVVQNLDSGRQQCRSGHGEQNRRTAVRHLMRQFINGI